MNFNFGDLLTILPLGIAYSIDNCDYKVAFIGGLFALAIALLNKLPIGKDKK